MPTKKPIVQVVLEQDIFDTLTEICEKEERSISNKCKLIIKEYISKYEVKKARESFEELRKNGLLPSQRKDTLNELLEQMRKEQEQAKLSNHQ